jgi:outer membrane protein OmpA-like peptidoglycan-associated protein
LNWALDFPVNKWTILGVCGAIMAVEFLGLRACVQSLWPQDDPVLVRQVDDSVVELRDGSVLMASQRTIGRDVIDWLNNASAPPARFDIGRMPFVRNSAAPAPDTQARVERFATELRAYPGVHTTVFVCTLAEGPGEASLATARANRLMAIMTANRVPADRISTQPCSVRNVRRDATASEQDGQRIGIALERRS